MGTLNISQLKMDIYLYMYIYERNVSKYTLTDPWNTIKSILRFLSISKEYPELEEPHKDDAVQRRRGRGIFMVGA